MKDFLPLRFLFKFFFNQSSFIGCMIATITVVISINSLHLKNSNYSRVCKILGNMILLQEQRTKSTIERVIQE